MTQNWCSQYVIRGIVSIFAILLLSGGCSAEERAIINLTFQQGLAGYSGTTLTSPRGKMQAKQRFGINGHILKFDSLEIPGKDIHIFDAQLWMKFKEEAWSRISNADLNILDVLQQGQKPLSSVYFKDRKLVELDPATSWVKWDIPKEVIGRWINNPDSNRGIEFQVIAKETGNFQFIFYGVANPVVEYRPKLIIRYSFQGNIRPEIPEIMNEFNGKTFGRYFELQWHKKRFDYNFDRVFYQIEIGPEGEAWRNIGEVPAHQLSFKVNTDSLSLNKSYRIRVRAKDAQGLTSIWAYSDGYFHISRKNFIIWTTDALHKVMQDELPNENRQVKMSAARNEYESFQIIISAFGTLSKVNLSFSPFVGPGETTITTENITPFKVVYVDCEEEGWLPDCLVPFVNPVTKKNIHGKYGTPFDVKAGYNQPIWVDVYVPPGIPKGNYKGKVRITMDDEIPQEIPILLKVRGFDLPKISSLKTYFSVKKGPLYLKELHKHRIDPWCAWWVSPQIQEVGDKVEVFWPKEYDETLDSYFNGSLFSDGIPGKNYFIPDGREGTSKIKSILRGSSDSKRIQILKQFEQHFKDKPYVDKLFWFFIDEPKKNKIDEVSRIARQVKEYSPSLKFLLTTGYKEKLVGLVDVWDAILNVQVINSGSPGPKVYQDEILKGRDAINCITVNCNKPTVPNLFIQYPAIQTRIWPWATYYLGFSGIEYWSVGPSKGITKPRLYGHAWGDGALFYPGKPENIGGPEEIPLPSIRLKVLRDGIEDYEYLSLLAKYSKKRAEKMVREMVQSPKFYDNSFVSPVKHINWNSKMNRRETGHIIWESSSERLYKVRDEIARILEISNVKPK